VFRKILYPTDFSEFARKALDYVKKLREADARDGNRIGEKGKCSDA